MTIKNLIKITSTYMVCEIIIMAGGIISFPIFTRILTKQEYGVMNLIAITLSFVEAFSTAGLRHSSQRFFSDYKNSNKLTLFYSTTITSSILFGIVGSLVALLISRLATAYNLIPDNYSSVCVIASLLVFIRVMSKIIGCLYRVNEKAKTYSIVAILDKYIGMFLSILFVSIYAFGLFGFFLGLCIGEVLVLILSFIILLKESGHFNFSYSKSILNEMISYGMPLVIAGFAGVLLTMGGRYLIGYYMTAEDVAIYSVPYNLCSYITGIAVTAFEFALIPHIMNEWGKPNNGDVVSQIQNAIKIYCIFAFPIIFGIIALGEKFIILFASKEYAASSNILPYVITGEMLKGLLTPLVIGLQFSKNTAVLTRLTWCTALLNTLLNILLIPRFGLVGAAAASLFCYLVLMILGARASSKYFSYHIPWLQLFRYFLCSVLMYVIIQLLEIYSPIHNLLMLVVCGALTFFFMLMIVDKGVKSLFVNTLIRIRESY